MSTSAVSAYNGPSYDSLPKDVLDIVFSNLDIPALSTAERVCKTWQKNTENSWKRHLSRDWPDKPKDPRLSAKICYQIEVTREKKIAFIDRSARRDIESGKRIERRSFDANCKGTVACLSVAIVCLILGAGLLLGLDSK